MKSIKMIWFDGKNFIKKNKKRFLLPLVFSAATYFILSGMAVKMQAADAQAMGIWDAGAEVEKVGFMDWWYYVFAGLSAVRSSEKFQVPACWIVSNLFLLFTVSGYVSFARRGMGQLAMIKCNSPLRWWMGKGVLNLFSVLAYYLLLSLPAVLITTARGCFIQGLTPAVLESLSLPLMKENDGHTMVFLLFLPVVSSFALLFLMELLELYLGAALAFLCMAVGMVASAYLALPLTDQMFVMLRRTAFCTEGGVEWTGIASLSLFVILISQFAGWRKCRRMDAGLESEKKE